MEPHVTRRDLLKYSMGTLMLPAAEESRAATADSSALLLDPIYRQHDPGAGHPERPERYDAVTQALNQAGLTKSMGCIDPRSATEDEIAACHSRAYIQTVKREIAAGAHELSTGDTSVGPRTWEIA
jgi:acetoin utilization deacetylase AcuC-like enzyme